MAVSTKGEVTRCGVTLNALNSVLHVTEGPFISLIFISAADSVVILPAVINTAFAYPSDAIG